MKDFDNVKNDLSSAVGIFKDSELLILAAQSDQS